MITQTAVAILGSILVGSSGAGQVALPAPERVPAVVTQDDERAARDLDWCPRRIQPVRIWVDPANTQVQASRSATFEVYAPSNVLVSVQWQRSLPDLTTWENVGTETTIQRGGVFTYTTPAVALGDSGTKYRAIARNFCSRATSGEAVLTVIAPPVLDGRDIAVVLGNDAIYDTLARLGFGSTNSSDGGLVVGTESFRIFDSQNGQDSVQLFRQYPDWFTLFTLDSDGNGRPNLYDQRIVVFTDNVYEDLRADSAKMDVLRDYVRQGGHIITNGPNYLVEDLFPEYLDWQGIDLAPNVPETAAPSLRSESFYNDVYGRPDANLRLWLEPQTCSSYLVTVAVGPCIGTSINDMFEVDGVLPQVLRNSYQRLQGGHAGAPVRLLVDGHIKWTNPDGSTGEAPTHPLVADARVGAGRMSYITFQVAPAANVYVGGNISALTPHERIVQYLVTGGSS